MTTIAIIGAGIAGLTLANQLNELGEVTVFEKARGVSGRTSTRYADPYQFDHGAQYFTAKSEPFKALVEQLESAGVIARWDATFAEYDDTQITHTEQWNETTPHYVGSPRMNQIAKYIAADVEVKIQMRIGALKQVGNMWELNDEDGNPLGTFDWVISTAPAEQTTELLPATFEHHKIVRNTKMLACHTLMIGLEQPLDLPWQAASVKNAMMGWMAVNSSKPNRPEGYSLVLMPNNDWSEAHIDDDPEHTKREMIEEFKRLTGQNISNAPHQAIHRWRYANVRKTHDLTSLLDERNKLAACGDWCIEGGVEEAFTSAIHLSEQLKRIL